MSRKKTIDDKKNRRDILIMSIEEKKKALQPSIEALEKLNQEFAEEDEKALNERKDLFYELCAPVFGSHTTEAEVREWFGKIMTSERISVLKEKLKKSYKRKAEDQPDSDSDEILEDKPEPEESKT